MHSHKLKRLQAKNQTAMITATAVLLASLVVTAILPTLLIRYVYAGQQLFEQPVVLEYIPVVSFVIGIGYFLVAVVGNVMRAVQIRKLEKEMDMNSESCGCCGDGCSCGDCDNCSTEYSMKDDASMNDMGSLAEALVKGEKKSKSASKRTKSKSAKK